MRKIENPQITFNHHIKVEMNRWIVSGALIIVAVLVVIWISPSLLRSSYDTPVAPPGQFPIEDTPTEVWPASLQQVAFRPSRFTDEYRSTELVDPKRICGRRLYENGF